MKRTVFSVLSILLTVALLLFTGCTEDLPDNEDFSPGSQLKSAIVDSPIGNNGSKIVFSSNREDWQHDLWAMNIDGTNLTRLTYGEYGWGFKDISPNGQKVVFGCKKNNNIDIYIVNIDGSGFQKLTENPGPDKDPRFTQNGQKIVFASNEKGKPREIFTMNLDGSKVEQLTNLAWGNNHSPCLSKNGKELLFVRAFMKTGDIYKMDLNNGKVVRLTFDGTHKLLPSWSNNGKKIVYAARSGAPPTPYDIFVMDADGLNIENLTEPLDNLVEYPNEDRHPCWSPEGKHIIWHRKPLDDPQQLWVMNADGSDPVQITEGDLNNFPTWGPGRIE